MGATTVVTSQELAGAFAEATRSSWGPEQGGTPLLMGVVPTRTPILAALRSAIPEGLGDTVPILHGEHAVRWFAGWEVGSELLASARHAATEARSTGTTVTVIADLRTPSGELLEEHEITAFLPGTQLPPFGSRPTRPVPDARPLGAEELRVPTEPGQSRAYAAASGDDTAFHVDDDAARRYGFPGVILHGLCTLATSLNGLGKVLGSPLTAVSVRFAAPGIPGEDIVLRHERVDAVTLRFDALSPSGGQLLTRGVVQATSAP